MTTHTLTTDADAPWPRPPRPIRFARLLRVEWRKSIDTRAARWLLTAIALLTAGAAMVPLFLPQEIQQGWLSYLAMTALVLALLLPLVSIMTLTSEWGQRSVLVTFTQEPRRDRVVAAKVLSGLALALLGAAFAFAISAAAMAVSDMLGRSVAWSLEWKYAAGFMLFVIANSLMGMAFGALLLNTPAADRAVPGAPHAVDHALLRLARGHRPLAGHRADVPVHPGVRLGRAHRPDPGVTRGVGRAPAGARHRAHPAP